MWTWFLCLWLPVKLITSLRYSKPLSVHSFSNRNTPLCYTRVCTESPMFLESVRWAAAAAHRWPVHAHSDAFGIHQFAQKHTDHLCSMYTKPRCLPSEVSDLLCKRCGVVLYRATGICLGFLDCWQPGQALWNLRKLFTIFILHPNKISRSKARIF